MGNNKIIAISGQPVTGKGTTVEALIEKLKERGYSEENIHVISTGHEFRNYFNSIFEFIRNYDDSAELESLSQNPYLKSFVDNSEYREILINTLLQLKQNSVDLNNLNIEQANNLKEFSGLRKIIDSIIDTNIEEMGKQINSEPRLDEVWIVDSRLAFHNIPQAFSVRLVSDPRVAAKRLLNDKSRGKEDSQYANIEEALQARENRRRGEQKRYKKRYGVDLEDENNYDLIIDTSYSTIEDTAETILTCLDCYTNNKPFAKNWASPKMFIPMQNVRDTIGMGTEYTLNELGEKIKQEGYHPDKPIEVIEVDGIKYIIEGHHRNFAVGLMEKTLIPYEVTEKDDEVLLYSNITARQRVKYVNLLDLYDHEACFGSDFRYTDIYPEIYDKVKSRNDGDEGR